MYKVWANSLRPNIVSSWPEARMLQRMVRIVAGYDVQVTRMDERPKV